jgi:hypothetical protein
MISPYRRLAYVVLFICTTTSWLWHSCLHADRTTIAKNDAYPVYSSIDPQEFLLTKLKAYLHDDEWLDDMCDHCRFSVSVFGQNANDGKNIGATPVTNPLVNPPLVVPANLIPLGDLTGRPGMLALLFGNKPKNVSDDAYKTQYSLLSTAITEIFMMAIPDNNGLPIPDLQANPYVDRLQVFGYFSFPLKYRKRGVAFEWLGHYSKQLGDWYSDFVLRIRTRVVSVSQTSEGFIDRTLEFTDDSFPPDGCTNTIAKADVECFLMDRLEIIAKQIGINLKNFSRTSVEAIDFGFIWRHLCDFNSERPAWPRFLLTPFFELDVSVSPGKRVHPSRQFAVPFGNDGHNAVGFSTGVCIDFIESIEISGEVGMDYFFSRAIEGYRVPTSKFQTTLFPFTANVRKKPGFNWHFTGKIAAYHFLERLSMHFEYSMMEHKKDSICLCDPDPAFLTKVLENTTRFKTKLINLAFNYDLTPNMRLGLLWQAPLSQRNSYRSTTILFTFDATF